MIDSVLLLVFGGATVIGLAVGVFGFWMATRAARKKLEETRMVSWAILGLAGFILSAVSFVYFVLPLLSAL
jgi:hypothetical protein